MANVLVFGHQNPDNDAIMSAVVLSQLLNQVEYAGNTYEACALGQLPAESAKLLADAGIADEHDGVWMPGVLSRKKQVAAPIMAAC